MISYQIIEHGRPLQKLLAETPKPQGREVLMRVPRAGVCHSDLHIWEGYFDLGGGKRFYVKERGCLPPFTLGHEPFGVVEALGPRARGVKVGDKRLVYPWIGCGKCAVCKAGQDNYCVSGSRFLGVNCPVNTKAPDALEQVRGIAAAIDFVGAPATAGLGIAALRKGGRYVICGLFGGELVHPLPPIAQRAIGIIGSYVGSLQELKEVVALAKKKKIKPTPVETRPADQANSALEDLKAGRVLGR